MPLRPCPFVLTENFPASDLREKPPASLLLIHGAGSGPWIFQGWEETFPKIFVEAIDLHSGVNLSSARMDDYARGVARSVATLAQPVSLCGWSMGGLVALLASQTVSLHSLILLEPSPPAETQGFNPDVQVKAGTFDPADAYGPFPPGQISRPESELARAERKRGISITSVSCPTLVVYGKEFVEERGRAIARLYAAEERYFPELDHWALILDPKVRKVIASYFGIDQPL